MFLDKPQSWNASLLNLSMLDQFTYVMHNKNGHGEKFTKTPFMFLKFLKTKNNQIIEDTIYSEFDKINHTLSVYAKSYDFYRFGNTLSSGNCLIFRNWFNGENNDKLKALTIVELVEMSKYSDEQYYTTINNPVWFPTFNDFDTYKNKTNLTQTIFDYKKDGLPFFIIE
jgi:hypothetical protein